MASTRGQSSPKFLERFVTEPFLTSSCDRGRDTAESSEHENSGCLNKIPVDTKRDFQVLSVLFQSDDDIAPVLRVEDSYNLQSPHTLCSVKTIRFTL